MEGHSLAAIACGTCVREHSGEHHIVPAYLFLLRHHACTADDARPSLGGKVQLRLAGGSRLSDPGGYIMSEKNRDPKIQGEGDYESARRYRKGVERFVAENDTEELAREAAPDSEQEADEMLDAEREGRSRSKVRKPEDTQKER